ncbi:MAG: radical SAM protein, partial [Syntrophales bacterium LBB04]|nr:radical SAM protein [Syntrophales bacterium LBB04]
MPLKILLLTPPFTQLNTPYPATPHLKGFLNLHGYESYQADLGIDLISTIFSRNGFESLFTGVRKRSKDLSPNSTRIVANEQAYLGTIDPVMKFLRYRDDTLAPLLCTDAFLPKASRFDQLPDLEWSFGAIGVNDKARLLATLYIEDIGDLIRDGV